MAIPDQEQERFDQYFRAAREQAMMLRRQAQKALDLNPMQASDYVACRFHAQTLVVLDLHADLLSKLAAELRKLCSTI